MESASCSPYPEKHRSAARTCGETSFWGLFKDVPRSKGGRGRSARCREAGLGDREGKRRLGRKARRSSSGEGGDNEPLGVQKHVTSDSWPGDAAVNNLVLAGAVAASAVNLFSLSSNPTKRADFRGLGISRPPLQGLSAPQSAPPDSNVPDPSMLRSPTLRVSLAG